MVRVGKIAESSFLAKKMVKKGYCGNEGLSLFLIRSVLKVRFDAKRCSCSVVKKLSKTVSIMCGPVHVVTS